jgi:choline dehydrogenase-like flavoprotein
VKIVVVGAGVSGAHAALTLLERNFNVELWDVGREENPFPEKGATFQELKSRLDDPADYFLGDELVAMISPASNELLRYPPSRHFLMSRDDPLWDFEPDGFEPFGSYNRGGLANGWGANAISYDDNDMADWPISAIDMESAYRSVYERIPVAGPTDDELAPYLSGTYPSQPPVQLSTTDKKLLRSYEKNRHRIERLGVVIGHARLAVVTDSQRENSCDYCDRCLWGCPRKAIYNPVFSTLKSCESYKGFSYRPGRKVLSLLTNRERIDEIRYLDTESGQIHQESCDAVFLAAGALESGGIFLRTLKSARPDISPTSAGLMDTHVVKLPYVMLNNIGQPADCRSFQFNRLIMGIIQDDDLWPRYLHGEMLHLSSLLYHPLIEWLPFDSLFSKRLFFTLKSALGTISLFFPDKITPDSRQTLVEGGERWERIQLHSRESKEKESYILRSIGTIRSALWRLGCVPKGVVHSPAGGGIHYAGTIPMGDGPKRCDPAGRSNLFPNLYIADGAAFPSLPSKSITLSLAAHTTRVARNAML